MAELKDVFETVTRQAEPDPDSWNQQERRQRRTVRNRKVGAFAVAAAIGLAAVALFLGTRPGDGTLPADTTSTVDRSGSAAQDVATGFITAIGDFDVERAMSYLADDADITGLIDSVGVQGVGGTTAALAPFVSLMEAYGYEQLFNSLKPCEQLSSSASGTDLRCAFVFQSLRSDEIGLGPFNGSFFDITVLDGEIVRASMYWETEKFSPQVWEPFAAWVSTTYPEDAAVMYEDDSYGGAQLTEESIRLWERHTKEYVEIATPEMLAIAKRFMEARNAYDSETAMSLLADGTVTAQLLFNNRLLPDMFGVELNHDELALAFEAERLYGVRYRSFECRREDFRLEGVPGGNGSSANVICSYSMDSRLRQLAGAPPLTSAFGLGIHGGKIDVLTFPWLNISWGPGGYYPPESEKFVMWLDAAHPEAIDAGDPMAPQRLFRVGGQEWILKMDRASLDLLASYLDEYERSVSA
jgi:hypothetical protein